MVSVIVIGTLTYGIGNSNRDTYVWYRNDDQAQYHMTSSLPAW